jgi:NTP pyrophosphatase (non-canonical NTP hydrolase)
MNLTSEFEPIREWAEEKGIYEKGDPKTQTLKLVEEVGELSKAVINEDIDEVKDAIGDCVVVLVSVAELSGLSFEECVNSAYNVIKNRKGKMQNGSFKKDK